MKEREISLIDLLAEIMLRWRGIIVFMLVGGIFLGGLSYVRSYQNISAQEALQEAENIESLEELEEQLTETEKLNVYTVLYNEGLYQDMTAYMDGSVLMQIDPLNVQQIKLLFSITSEERAISFHLMNVYNELIDGAGLYEWLAEKNGLTSAAASELIETETRGTGIYISDFQDRVSGIDGFQVTVVHYDSEKCEALAQSIIDYINGQHDGLVQSVGRHEITLLGQDHSIVTDTDLMNLQRSYNANLFSVFSTVVKAKDAFTESEKKYYDLLQSNDITGEAEESEAVDSDQTRKEAVAASPSVSLKYILLGMILGGFIAVFVVFLCYVLNSKIRATDDLNDIYEIPQLGMIPNTPVQKKLFAFVDKWIISLRDRNKRQFSPAEATELATTAVKITAEKNKLDTIYLMGCDLKEDSLKLCQQIQDKLGQENISVRILNNVLYDAETLEQLAEAKGVVLVEKAGSTLYTEIVQELELLKRQEIMILGGIVIE